MQKKKKIIIIPCRINKVTTSVSEVNIIIMLIKIETNHFCSHIYVTTYQKNGLQCNTNKRYLAKFMSPPPPHEGPCTLSVIWT